MKPLMSSGKRVLSLLPVLAFSLGTGIAKADPPGPAYWGYERSATVPFERGQLYAGFTISGGVQQLPRFNSGLTVFDSGTGAFLGSSSFDSDVGGAQPGGEFGYVFRDGTLPAWMGSRVRIGIYGSVLAASRSQNRDTALPPNGDGAVYGVNGAPLPASPFSYGIFPGASLIESLKVRRTAFQAGLKFESDIPMGPNMSWTPAIAIFGGHIWDNYEYAGTVRPALNFVVTGMNERLRTTEFGGSLGARFTWQFFPGLALHAGGTAGPVWMRSRLSASDCVNAFHPMGVPCGPLGPSFGTSSASDSRSKLGFRGTASLGLSADLRYALISFGGFMRYDSHIPGVQNPQTTTPFTGAALAPAHIRFDDGFAYGGFLTLRVPMPY